MATHAVVTGHDEKYVPAKWTMKMISRVLGLYEELKLPNKILSRTWKSDSETVASLKKFAMENNSDLDHLDWRIIEFFIHERGFSDGSRLSEVFNSPIIEVGDFRRQMAGVGVRPKKTNEALSRWVHLLDMMHVHLSCPRESELPNATSEERFEVHSESRRPPAKKPSKPSQIADKDGGQSSDSTSEGAMSQDKLRAEAKKNLQLYQDEDIPVEEQPIESAEAEEGLGAYRPVDVNNSWHKGYLYYPVQVINGKKVVDSNGAKIKEKIETVVVRSDRTLQKIVKSERLKEGDHGQDVLRLTDGTLINSIPRPNIHGTWSWPYIERFITGETSGVDLAETIVTIRKHLRSRVWLPLDADYTLLAMTAVATYVQSVFDSVPLILLVGPHGSGKSELGTSMAEVSANATMIGQVSAATMMRLIDESGGLCVIDDLESVGVTKGAKGKQKFGDLAQALKVSYKKSTASRVITNPRTHRTEVMNFYGIKIISNTKGADDILGSRMLHINTKHINEEALADFQEREGVDEELLSEIRNRLHMWAFENVAKVHTTYVAISAKQSDRETEIAEPLRTIAKLSEDQELMIDLEMALTAQSRRKNATRQPEEVLKDIVTNLIAGGYEQASITHIMLELRKEMDPGYQINYDTDMPGWSRQEWIGRKLRDMKVLDEGKAFRKRVRGQNLRFVTFKRSVVRSVRSETNAEPQAKKPEGFCKDCSTCQYAKHGCIMMESGLVSQAS